MDTKKDVNRLLSRMVVGKPDLTLSDVRRLVPQLRLEDDEALKAKLASIKGQSRRP